MGCLTSIFKKILILLAIIAFFALGGYSFVKEKINEYKNPSRIEFVSTEKNYGDFSSVPSDYQLSRNFNLFGYKKITAKYLPTNQKITIIDIKNTDLISPKDFKTNNINEKIENILEKTKDSFITFENFKITQKNIYYAKNKQIPFVKFEAKVKNIPFKEVSGIIACYETKNTKAKEPTPKIIITMTDLKAFNPTIPANFIKNIKF